MSKRKQDYLRESRADSNHHHAGVHQHDKISREKIYGGICPEHSESITNFCLSSDCLEPLCPECLENHSKLHRIEKTYADIHSVRTVANICSQKTKNAILLLNQEFERNNMQYMQDPKTMLETGRKMLNNSKQKLINFIDSYFDELWEKFNRKVQENAWRSEDYTPVFEKFKDIIQELHFLDQEISKPPDENYHRWLTAVSDITSTIKIYNYLPKKSPRGKIFEVLSTNCTCIYIGCSVD